MSILYTGLTKLKKSDWPLVLGHSKKWLPIWNPGCKSKNCSCPTQISGSPRCRAGNFASPDILYKQVSGLYDNSIFQAALTEI